MNWLKWRLEDRQYHATGFYGTKYTVRELYGLWVVIILDPSPEGTIHASKFVTEATEGKDIAENYERLHTGTWT